MGLKKVNIDMQTVMQKDRGKDSLNFDEFFTLSEKFLNSKKLEGLRDRTIEDYITNFRYLKNFAYRFSQNRHIVNDIDIKNSFIRVRSEVSKTVMERILPISKKTGKYLDELIKIALQMDSQFVFQSTYGGQIKKQNLELSFNRLKRRQV